MLETPQEPSVSVALIRILKGYAKSLNIDFHAIADAVGLDINILKDGEARVSGSNFKSMWIKIVSASKDPYPGLHFGQEMARQYPGGNILFTMMMNCATIDKALDTFIRYHRIMADTIQPQAIKDGDRVRLSWNILHPDFEPNPYMSEALLCTYHSIFEYLSEGRLHPVEICFTHSCPDELSEYKQVFKSPLKFEAERNELMIGIKDLGLEIRSANQELFEVLENYAAQLAGAIGVKNDWSSKILTLISEMFVRGIKPDVDSVSKKLAVSRRNLQEKLKEEKTSFRNCLEMVRKQIALDYLLKPDVTICDITFLLGYSEQSAFNHAFRRWTGKTPKEYRTNI